ncbi:vomeronasal type-2 receptor 1 [Thalassophryne amazonica]|uniref:vomeronasal type-2 receptor 1 n=1 Tax=Thalassophryne amazonica TaxID=390379 RepID=UPI001471F21E|nr:vomeronasal type-2 receptor 1 [Thalassophryne amazonica]
MALFRFNFRAFRWTQTMLFAINEINMRTDLLPKTDLGYVIYDSCFTISKAVEGTLTYLTGQDEAIPNYRCGSGAPLAALVGAGGSDLSIATARILGLYHFPQVSYASSSSMLNSKFQFPTFLRTIPNDVHQSAAMAQLVLHFGWTWVGTIAADDDYGKYGIKDFKEQVEEADVCISFSEVLPKAHSPEDIQRIVETVVKSTAKIIVVFSSDVDFSPLILELLRHNVTNRTWIASEAWVTSSLINQPGVDSVLGGTLGFALKRADIPNLQHHLLDLDPYDDPLTEELWETLFNCTLDYGKALKMARLRANRVNETHSRAERSVPDGLCTGKESLARLNNTYSDVSQLRITYSVYKAVYAVAHALHNLEHCEPGKGPFTGNNCADITNFEPWQLMYYLMHVRFTMRQTGEEVYFTDGDVEGLYDIINWQVKSDGQMSYITVGHYNGSAPQESRMVLLNDSIVWNKEELQPPRSVCNENCEPGTRKGIRQGEPVCCFDCIPCANGEISNTTNARACIQCTGDDWSNDAHDACVPKLIEFLAFGEPLGITLIVISAFGALVTIIVMVVFIVHLDTPLVKANDALLSFSLLFSLVVTFLCSIVFLGEPQPWSCMTSQVALALGFALCLSSIMGKAAVLMLRAQALKAAHAKAKAAAKAAKAAAAEAAANTGSRNVIATNTNTKNNVLIAGANPEVDILTFGHQRAIVVVATIIQGIACTVWLIILPPHPVKNTSSQNVKIILECDEGSVVFICCIFAYDILLALLAFIFAFIARKLEDHFSEAKCVTFGMLVFFIVWISFVPAYLSTRGKFMIAVQIFAILASSFGLLTCIFLPKCYVLLIKPERNTEAMMKPRPKPRDGTSTGTSTSLATAATEVNATIASTAIDD